MGLSATKEVQVERRRKQLPRRKDDLARRIRETLLALARESGVDVLHIPVDLEAAVILSFEEAWRDQERREAMGFHFPFGEGSHRWGVKLIPN
jgi:hypothetical protein